MGQGEVIIETGDHLVMHSEATVASRSSRDWCVAAPTPARSLRCYHALFYGWLRRISGRYILLNTGVRARSRSVTSGGTPTTGLTLVS